MTESFGPWREAWGHSRIVNIGDRRMQVRDVWPATPDLEPIRRLIAGESRTNGFDPSEVEFRFWHRDATDWSQPVRCPTALWRGEGYEVLFVGGSRMTCNRLRNGARVISITQLPVTWCPSDVTPPHPFVPDAESDTCRRCGTHVDYVDDWAICRLATVSTPWGLLYFVDGPPNRGRQWFWLDGEGHLSPLTRQGLGLPTTREQFDHGAELELSDRQAAWSTQRHRAPT